MYGNIQVTIKYESKFPTHSQHFKIKLLQQNDRQNIYLLVILQKPT